MDRREFLLNAYRIGGLTALWALGVPRAKAGGILMMAGSVPAAGGGSQPTVDFYYNCNASSSNPQKGAASSLIYTDDAHFSFAAMTNGVGNGIFGSTAYYGWSIVMSGNMNLTTGTIGFVWRASTITGDAFVIDIPDATTAFSLRSDSSPNQTNLQWSYASGSQAITVAANTTYYIELSWDYANTRMSYRLYNLSTAAWVNGPSWTQVTGLTGGAPTSSAGELSMGSQDGAAHNQGWDQYMISPTYQADLQSIWNSTNP